MCACCLCAHCLHVNRDQQAAGRRLPTAGPASASDALNVAHSKAASSPNTTRERGRAAGHRALVFPRDMSCLSRRMLPPWAAWLLCRQTPPAPSCWWCLTGRRTLIWCTSQVGHAPRCAARQRGQHTFSPSPPPTPRRQVRRGSGVADGFQRPGGVGRHGGLSAHIPRCGEQPAGSRRPVGRLRCTLTPVSASCALPRLHRVACVVPAITGGAHWRGVLCVVAPPLRPAGLQVHALGSMAGAACFAGPGRLSRAEALG